MITIKNTTQSRKYLKLRKQLKGVFKIWGYNINESTPIVIKMLGFVSYSNILGTKQRDYKSFSYFENLSHAQMVFDRLTV